MRKFLNNYKMRFNKKWETIVNKDENNLTVKSYSPITLFPYYPKKKIAFTLAEVLITLGVIGVVAALVIPQLINNYQKQEVPVRLKKLYNTLHEAIRLAEIENGDSTNWTFENNAEGRDFYITKIRSKMNCIYTKKGYNIHTYADPEAYCFLPDGSAIAFYNLTGTSLLHVIFVPFPSRIRPSGNYHRYEFPFQIYLGPFPYYQADYRGKTKVESIATVYPEAIVSRDRLLNGPQLHNDPTSYCKYDGISGACFYLIRRDGWKISNDYPW